MAKKRSRGTHSGSIYQSGGAWFCSVMVAGRRRRTRHKTKAEANAALRPLIEQAKAEAHLRPGSFGELREQWVRHVRANKATKTAESYYTAVQKFSELDELPVFQITPGQLQRILDSLSGRSRQQAFDILRKLMRDAVSWGWLSQSPMDPLQRPSHQRAPILPFTLEEVRRILEEVEETRYGPAIHLALACGLRGGELWGLNWGDWTGETLRVRRQACETAEGIEIKETKTSSGNRLIPLPPSVVKALEIRWDQRERDGEEGEIMFPNISVGRTRRTGFANRTWKTLLKELGIPHRGFHHARHTAATLLLNSGVPLSVVSSILGHRKISTTVDVYGHLMTGDLERFRNSLNAMLRRQGSNLRRDG